MDTSEQENGHRTYAMGVAARNLIEKAYKAACQDGTACESLRSASISVCCFLGSLKEWLEAKESGYPSEEEFEETVVSYSEVNKESVEDYLKQTDDLLRSAMDISDSLRFNGEQKPHFPDCASLKLSRRKINTWRK